MKFETFRNGNANFISCASRATAARYYPGAAIIVKVNGGYLCFESKSDYKTWKNQK